MVKLYYDYMTAQKMKRICVLTGGGDCPGLNATIRSVVKTATLEYGWEVWGSEDCFDGFMKPDGLAPLTIKDVRGILPRGGTILGTTNRGDPFQYPIKNGQGETEFHDRSQKVIEKAHAMDFHALILIGGDGTLSIGHKLFQAGLPIIGIPKTIDNDLLATEKTFGFDTAVRTATDAIDKIHTTAESHDRIMVMEVMGRNSGWIALEAGIAGGADVILIPEIPFKIEKICQKIMDRVHSGRLFSIVVVAEGSAPLGGAQMYREGALKDPYGRLGGIALTVGDMVREKTPLDTRILVLGHLQRGGSPSAFDRLLGTRFGWAAVNLAAKSGFGKMVSLKCSHIESVPLENAVAHPRLVDPNEEQVLAAKSIGISFGD